MDSYITLKSEKITKTIDPAVYSLIMTSGNNMRLWMGVCFDLDVALYLAKIYCEKEVLNSNWNMMAHTSIGINEIDKSLCSLVKEPNRNDLMKKIIDNKDVKLFEKNKKKFTVNERKLIKDSLK